VNRYILIHRLMGPAILLLLGTVALLHEAHIASWNIFVPLLLILIGVIKLAERAAIANDPYPPAQQYPGGPGPYNPAQPYSGQQTGTQSSAQAAATGTAIVPATHDFSGDANGGQQ
jgi:hypothetical protein